MGVLANTRYNYLPLIFFNGDLAPLACYFFFFVAFFAAFFFAAIVKSSLEDLIPRAWSIRATPLLVEKPYHTQDIEVRT